MISVIIKIAYFISSFEKLNHVSVDILNIFSINIKNTG
ncbi:hypothetical protein CLTEP_23920 [Clostridium tepidiprofundi DSM 19306]|uniref:Uncharacterized protein n=1 Tax=Clostridium tepidiprofundi DSM 19306 TaxID=1121338 RepID=A0A151AUR5_9CLOT|nr:hypothetical protein CLTEP_23920 [Clostridium tepidiprofundi DSM 19306]